MLNIIDLMIGAIGIRLVRKYKKMRKIPDVNFVRKNLSFGGKTPYERLLSLNIKTVIDLRAEKMNENMENELVQYHKFELIDGGVPTKSQISRIHEIIEENEKKEQGVFIHCNLGRGRATLTTFSYLLKIGIEWEDALKIIKKRKFVYLNKKQISFLKGLKNEKC